MTQKIGIVGVGSAGILNLAHFCTWLPNSWEVYSIHNPAKKILGIGESTNGGFVGLLERGTGFALGRKEDMAALDATLKFGSFFKNWRGQPWLNPLLDGNTAIHFNNFKFKEFAYERLAQLWPRKFRVLEGDVKKMRNKEDRVVVTIDETDHDFDFIIDCTGFPTDFRGYVMSDCTPVNNCLIHNTTDFDYEPHTDHVATPDGWMFGVPLQSRKTYGYLYNDNFTTKEQALENFRKELDVPAIDGNEYQFKCYYTNRLIDGRICKNGNKALFFEPIVANSIFLYIHASRLFFDYVMGEVDESTANGLFTKAVQELEDLISYYYQGGSIHQNEFWEWASDSCARRLKGRKPFRDLIETYKVLNEQGIMYSGPSYGLAPHNWRIIDEALGYDSF